MVKRISTFILSLVLLFSAICSAEATDVFGEGLTVYASKEEQETVCEALNGRVPISVTPVYYYILYDSDTGNGYKNGDEIVLSKTPRPGTFIYSVTLKDYAAPVDGTVYIYSRAMTVVESKNGQMTAGIISCTRSAEDNPNYLADSTNYADFAEDIRILSGRDEIIDPKYVRLVAIPNVGECFYIKDSTDEFFYYLSGYLGEIDITHGARIMRVGEDLERAAGEVKEYLERERKIQAGEIESGGSSSSDVETAAVEFHPATGDASDIEAYLGVKIDSFKTHFPEAFKAPVIWPYFVAGGAAIVAAAAVAVVLIVKKRRARASGEAPAEPAV